MRYLVVAFLLPWSIQATSCKLDSSQVFNISSHELLVKFISNNNKKTMSWNIDNYLNGVFTKDTKSLVVSYDKKIMPDKMLLYQWEKDKTDTKTHKISITFSGKNAKCGTVQLDFDKNAKEKWNSTFQWISKTQTIKANKYTQNIGLAVYLKPLNLFPKLIYEPTREKYYIYITKYVFMTALSNCKTTDPKGCYKDEELSKSSTLNKDCFEATPAMPSYSAAIVAYPDIKSVDVQYKSYKLKLWANKNQVNHLQLAKSKSVEVLKALEELTGVSYFDMGIKKLDQIAVSDYPVTAMEHWGLVVYRETALLYDKSYSTTKNKQQVSQIIANQFAHMWFGYFLMPKQFHWVWLNEGFAKYYEYFSVKIDEADKQFVVEELQEALAEDDVKSVAALNKEVSSKEDITAKYNNLAKRKGASLLRMLSYLIDEKNFKSEVKSYLNKVKGTTSPEQLWGAFTSPSKDKDVKLIMKDFTDFPGYPVVKVSLDNNKLIFMQVPFSYATGNDKKHKWKIPITFDIFTGSSKPKRSFLLLDEETKASDVQASDMSFVIVNSNQRGYFRTNYEENLWKKIIDALLSDKMNNIDDISRAHLVDDAFSMTRAKLMDYKTLFRMLPYLSNETSYYPWHAALRGLKYIRNRLQDEDQKNNLDEKSLDWLEPVIPKIADKRKTDVEKLREEMLHQAACAFKRQECLDQAKKETPGKPTEPTEHTPTNYKTMVENDDDNDSNWNKLWKQYEKSKSPIEKKHILQSLASSKNPKKLKELLDKSLDDGLTGEGMETAINAVAQNNPDGTEAAIDFVTDKHKQIADKLKDGKLPEILKNLAENVNSDEGKEKLENLLNNDDFQKEWNVSDDDKKQQSEILSQNKQWMDDNKEAMDEILGGVVSFHDTGLFRVWVNVFWSIFTAFIV